MKQAIKNSNKSSSPGPICITVELAQNEGEQFFHNLNLLMQASYFLGYFTKPWKKENRIWLKNPDKESYHLENPYHSISLSNILGKIYERKILQQATNWRKIVFSKGKIYTHIKKKKNVLQALLLLIEQMCERVASGKNDIAVFARQVLLTIVSRSFPAFSPTDSIVSPLCS